jgi:uracil-DNA glycosylase family protein
MPRSRPPDNDAVPDSIQDCRRCDLWKTATQAVPGEGPRHARIMLIGEQPGDEEDLQGRPFVGPAGRVLDECLAAAGLARDAVFITNAVKHFKWVPRGKRRLHQKPNTVEIKACNIWLDLEIARIKPHVIVALGATGLRALLGRTVTIDAARHQSLQHESGAPVIASYHPSAILRADDAGAARLRAALIEDLKRAQQLAKDRP